MVIVEIAVAVTIVVDVILSGLFFSFPSAAAATAMATDWDLAAANPYK